MVGWHHWLNGRVWASSGSWWWTAKPGVLQSMGPQRVGHDWATEPMMLRLFLLIAQNWVKVLTQFQCCVSLLVIPGSVTPWTQSSRLLHRGISQARILELVVISFSRGSSWTRDQTCVLSTGRWVLYHWAPGNSILMNYLKLRSNATPSADQKSWTGPTDNNPSFTFIHRKLMRWLGENSRDEIGRISSLFSLRTL